MRIRRQAAAGLQLAPEILEMAVVETAFEVRARVDAGRGVALKVNDVGGLIALLAAAAKKMIEADFVEGPWMQRLAYSDSAPARLPELC